MPFGSLEEGIASILVQQRDALHAEITPVYVPLLGKHFASDEAELFDLETSVRQFMSVENQRRVLVLYGDAGSGKSSFFQSLTLSLLAEYTPENPLPLFISLPTLSDPVHRAVEETLENYGFTEAQIDELKERHSFVFIFDGYDEIHQLQNLYISNRLNTWQAKLLISCRSQYVYNKGNPDIYFMPLLGERGQPHLLSTLYTAAFNETQITTYFALMRERGAVIPSDEELQIIPGLKALITTPFLLHMTVEVLPAILERYSAASSSDEDRRLKQMELYDAFITQWFLRQEAKLKTSGHITEVMPDKKPTFWRYAQALAVEMHKHEVTWVSPHDERFAVFFDSDAETEMLRSACPLKKSGESFGFWHQSLGTYFTVRTMYEEECAHATELTAAEPAVMGAGVGAGSGTSVSSISVPPPIGGIHNRLITDDFSALKLLTDQVDAQFKKRLFDIIEASKVDEHYAIGAANAITVLNWAGVMLIRKNWQGIQIPGANLSHAILVGSDLSRANLGGVTLYRANLSRVNLTAANLTNIEFLERAPVKIKKNYSGKISCHPTNGWIAITHNNVIHQYDTNRNCWVNKLEGHALYHVNRVAYSPDGKLLASASMDEAVRQWVVETGELFGPILIGCSTYNYSVTYSPNGKYVASGDADGSVRQWIVSTGELFGPILSGHTKAVKSIIYSSDGKLLASASADGTIRQWAVETGELFGPTLVGHAGCINSVDYSPNGKYLVSGSDDGTVRQWSVNTGDIFGPVLVDKAFLTEHSKKIHCVVYSPDGKFLMSGNGEGAIRQWEAETGKPFGLIFNGDISSPISDIGYLSGGRYLVSHSNGAIKQFLVDKPLCLPIINESFSLVGTVAYSNNRKYFAFANSNGIIQQWLLGTGENYGLIFSGVKNIRKITYSPDDKNLFFLDCNSNIYIWNFKTGRIVGEFSLAAVSGADIDNLVFSSCGRYLSASFGDNSIHQWATGTGASYGGALINHTNKINAIAYSPDGNFLASASNDKTICQWSVETGEVFSVFKGHQHGVKSVAYSPDGLLLASGSSDCTVRQWVVKTGELFGPPLEGHSGPVLAVVYSQDRKYLASISENTAIQWLVETGEQLSQITSTGLMQNIIFLLDGRCLVLSEEDGRKCLRQLESGNKSIDIWFLRFLSNPLVASELLLDAVVGLREDQRLLLHGAGCKELVVPSMLIEKDRDSEAQRRNALRPLGLDRYLDLDSIEYDDPVLGVDALREAADLFGGADALTEFFAFARGEKTTAEVSNPDLFVRLKEMKGQVSDILGVKDGLLKTAFLECDDDEFERILGVADTFFPHDSDFLAVGDDFSAHECNVGIGARAPTDFFAQSERRAALEVARQEALRLEREEALRAEALRVAEAAAALRRQLMSPVDANLHRLRSEAALRNLGLQVTPCDTATAAIDDGSELARVLALL